MAKKKFEGFPVKTSYTPIPNPFFGSVMPHIQDMAELKVTLYIFWALYRKKGYPRFVTRSELCGDQSLILSLGKDVDPETALIGSLTAAVNRGTLLSLKLERENESDDLYFLNTELDRQAIDQIESGKIQLGKVTRIEAASTEERPNIFSLYEQHVGLLIPLIADDLKEAEKVYPASWIEDAFKEAVSLNKRNWRYISRILERWASQGKDYGTSGEGIKTDISPKEYIRRFGHLTKK
ncbi:MAG: DnaD domain protein [Desulfatiglandales bacterium]|nr:DnaD domain protein [Desulfatiglandales bacterium]